ncbi:MAG TPA: four helix bundle protein [Verrucomicrobiae bacterium]|nr:four helix bundle protein [Verrucomicrobiae bacterium]
MKDFRQLDVWRLGQELAVIVYRLTAPFPREERYGLTDQVRRAAVSIPANLAEGCGRAGDADFARFVQIAFGSACELESLLLLCQELAFLKATDHDMTQSKLSSVKRMLAALLKKLKAER